MKKKLSLLCLLFFLNLTGQALAYSISLVPNAQTIQAGAATQVDVNLFLGPGEELFGFNFALTFDPNILRFDNLIFGSPITTDYVAGFTAPLPGSDNVVTFDGGLIALAGATADILPLSSLYFTGLSLGSSPLLLNGTVLDLRGLSEVPLADAGSVDVVPEPGTCLLFGTGLAGLLGFRRKLRRA